MMDYQCTHDNGAGISREVSEQLGLNFPEAYQRWDKMADIALAIKEQDEADFCILPFCHTVEGEAMGGEIKYGDGNTGPRASKPVCHSPEDVLLLPQINYQEGRIKEVLQACSYLKRQGETVVLEVSGPLTILNVLADAAAALKWLRKQPQAMEKIFNKLREELLRYMAQACEAGVAIISYADSAAGLTIIGPRQMELTVEQFTYPLLREADRILPANVLIQLCPKTSLALIGTKKASWGTLKLADKALPYGAACVRAVGKARFAGQTCIKNSSYHIQDSIQTIELRQEEEKDAQKRPDDTQ